MSPSRMQNQSITEPSRQTAVAYQADVVVVGGGPGGFAAALKAARSGARTILVEQYDMPGGVHTSGLQGAANPGVGGIHTELMQRFAEAGCIYTVNEESLRDWAGNPLSHYEARLQPGSAFTRSSFNPEAAGSIMVRMLEEAGVTALYGTSFVEAAVDEKGIIREVLVENASGRQALRGTIFIDGTGTAELVARTGAPFVRGGGAQPATARWDGLERPIPGALLWIMSGVDFPQLAAYQKRESDPVLTKLIATATAAGDLPEGLYRPRMAGSNIYGNAYIGHPTLDMSPIQAPGTFILWQNVPYEWALHMDDDAHDEARAKATMRQFIEAEARFLKKYVPGFGNAWIANVGRYVGVRDGRHPVGEYVFSLEDARSGKRFPDAVTRALTKTFHWEGHREYNFEVPYRSFLPKKIGNLLLTGASMSFSYETIFMVMRNFPWCMKTGEIAGHAATMCLERGVIPRELSWSKRYF